MGNRGRPRKVVHDEPDEEISFNKTSTHRQKVPGAASGRLTRAKTVKMTKRAAPKAEASASASPARPARLPRSPKPEPAENHVLVSDFHSSSFLK